ncbi:MAG: putative glutamine amidotransferase [Rhodospirillaceae bacterium]|nr:MAG: putative glutamine amidotransferase [Rhodospirillaceae bacterium]
MTTTRTLPVIGITLDSEAPGGYARMPWYALRQNYCAVVARAGGLPLPLPHLPDLVAAYLERLDGLVLTGGAFDIDPALFGATVRHATVTLKEDRTRFELALLMGALARDMPVLGICGGQQLLNVALGGTLVQHIPDEVAGCLAHEQPNPRTEAGHEVMVTPESLLYRVVAERTLAVNSAHHQAVRTVGPGVVVSARAADGVIEAIEAPARRFCLGVQWHPEYEITRADSRLFAALVRAAAEP